ncbi:MAG: hypothetical protein ACT4P7_14145 [Gemmatimonadaceae bacterium]
MRARTVVTVGVVTALIVSCSGGRDGGPLADDLKRDLEASSTTLELAGQPNAQPMRFVSELEQGKTAELVERTRAPRRVASRTTGTEPKETTSPSPEVQQEVQVAEVVSEQPQAPLPAPDAPTVPMVAPRPASLPVDVPTDGGRGIGGRGVGNGDYGTGIGIGDVIGVVIRGGGVGPDHCPPPRRRPRGRIFP